MAIINIIYIYLYNIYVQQQFNNNSAIYNIIIQWIRGKTALDPTKEFLMHILKKTTITFTLKTQLKID